MNRKKIVVALSGGVDSSVSACLLHEQGHEVIGLFMHAGADPSVPRESAGEQPPDHATARRERCCSPAEAADARSVADVLGIEFHVLDFAAEFDRLIDYLVDEYVSGRTPNPCIKCNAWLKFGRLMACADRFGADGVATGHHVRLEHRGQRIMLRKGADAWKDQSYFLYSVEPRMLRRAFFPIGHLTKEQVRAEAERFGLPARQRPESTELCFVPDQDYARLVRQRRPGAFREGDILDPDGNVLGKHDGIANYTIGQRRGLGVAAGRPVYVTAIDAAGNTVVLGDREHLLHESLIARTLNFFDDLPREPLRCSARIRYQHQPAACTARVLDDGTMRVDFDEPQSAITPGQAVVLYDDEIVLGGGWIDRAC